MASEPKSIFVTGGYGFLGSHFIQQAFDAWPNARIVNYDILGPGSNLANVKEDIKQSTRYSFVCGSLSNERLLQNTLEEHKVDHVVHFAAESDVGFTYEHKLEAVQNIVKGTLSLLEAIRATHASHLKRFLYVSTDEVYGDSSLDKSAQPKREETILEPTSPYAATKAAAEMLINSYYVAYGIPAVRVRICNIYGSGQSHAKVVPKFIDMARQGGEFTIHGDGLQQRTWLHVSDASKAMLQLLTQGAVGDVYNVASKTEISILDLAKTIHHLVVEVQGPKDNAQSFQAKFLPDRPYNDRRYVIDSGKYESKFGPVQTIEFEDGMKQVIKAYLNEPTSIPRFGKVLVWGGKGWIGGQFVKLLESLKIDYVLAATHLGDAMDSEVEEEIIRVAPSHCITLMGRTHGPGFSTIDYLEGGPDKLKLNVRDNLYGPVVVADICTRLGIHYTYIGSGCLFNYDHEEHPIGGKGFTEEDVPNYFGSSYSVVKGFTDRILHHYNDSVLNIRMRLPVAYESNSRNLVTKIANYPKIADLPNAVTVLPELLPVLVDLMERKYTGTINFVNPGTTKHSDTLKCYKKLVAPNLRWDVLDVTTEEARVLLAKRSNCALDTSLIQKLAPQLSEAQAGINEAVRRIANEKSAEFSEP